jgi:hypothetical protein
MPQQDTDGLDTDAERAIVARLIENRSQVVTHKQLRAATPQLTPARRDAAVASLKRARVLLVERDGVRAAAPLRRLGALRMVVF